MRAKKKNVGFAIIAKSKNKNNEEPGLDMSPEEPVKMKTPKPSNKQQKTCNSK